jgi:hypothetical protein
VGPGTYEATRIDGASRPGREAQVAGSHCGRLSARPSAHGPLDIRDDVAVQVLAALPERFSDVGGVVIGIYLVIVGIALASGPERVTTRWPPAVARSLGFALVLAGPVIGTFLLLSEGGCDRCSPWGTTQEQVIAVIWLLFVGAIAARIVWKAFGPRSHSPS